VLFQKSFEKRVRAADLFHNVTNLIISDSKEILCNIA